MPETEQYFSSDNPTASSTAFRETFPPTRYTSLISVYTIGTVEARSASARTSRLVNGSLFLRRILTISDAVQLHSPISTSSIGLLAVLCSPASATIACPLDAIPTKRSLSVHCALAVTITLLLNSYSCILCDYRCTRNV